MAFNGITALLYGGIGDFSAGPGAEVFHLTWEWNGKVWTARQDMGPGPRIGHTLAFDTTRLRLVLFGGLAVPPSADNAAQRVMGDTWEATTDRVFVELVGLELSPNPVVLGNELSITIFLAAPSPGFGEIMLLADDEPFARLMIQPKETSISITVSIPLDVPPGDYTIIARSGASQVVTVLTIVA
jgi:hypothetical protein